MELKFVAGDHVFSQSHWKGFSYDHHAIVISTHDDGTITIMDYRDDAMNGHLLFSCPIFSSNSDEVTSRVDVSAALSQRTLSADQTGLLTNVQYGCSVWECRTRRAGTVTTAKSDPV